MGTTDKVTSLDPAGSYDNGSFFLMNQIYPFLLNTAPGATDMTPQPDIAESASFTTETEYTVKLKAGLKFANGHDLTSSDVKFSFDRMMKINDPNGPASLLGNLASTTASDPTTVVFKLKNPNDVVFAQLLTSPAAPIIDEEVFPADKVMADPDIVAGKPFAGQYSVATYNLNQLVSLTPNADYKGMLGAAKSAFNIKYYAASNNLLLDIGQGNIDLAHRSLSATDIASLKTNDKVKLVEGPGGEMRYLVFNFNTMPFGAKAQGADPKKALAVRMAMADLVDRQKLATDVYKDTYTPLYSFIPDGQIGANTILKDTYGEGGAPSVDKAKKALADAGITSKVTLNIQYNGDHYGPSSGDEYAALKTQLEAGDLFTVNLQSTEWVQYSKDRVKDLYPVYQLGWFPDYSDPDNYVTPFFSKDNFLQNHFDDGDVQGLINKQATTTKLNERLGVLTTLQEAPVSYTHLTLPTSDLV